VKRILVLNGHPAAQSLSRTLAEAYADAARQAGHDVRLAYLHELQFDNDYEEKKPLEPRLDQLMQDLAWSEHFVMTTPMWWGGIPAKLKGLFDRAFLPGMAYDPRKLSRLGIPAPLLVGRTARVVFTSDTPGWFFRLVYKNALVWQLRRQILEFVGLKPARFTHLGPASHPKPGEVTRWLKQVRRLGTIAA
jgi:NAD(P)H dehydrogenase (quinone)